MRVKIPPSEALRQEIFRLQEVGLEGVSNPLDMFVRLSSRYMLQMGMERDVEELFKEVWGEGVISKTGVSQLSHVLLEEFDRWRKRDLSGLRIVYLFLDAVYLPVRQGTAEKEGLLCAYGLTEEGKRVFIHLALGSRESYDSWISFLHDMTAGTLFSLVGAIHVTNPPQAGIAPTILL